jgi:hypothetical protein
VTRALLLIGSPKPGASASRTFADALGTRLSERGLHVRTERVSPAFSDASRTGQLLEAVAQSELVVLAFPVYVDSLPAPVLRLLESWRDALADGVMAAQPNQRLAVLTQCGFPEASHCDVAVEVCRLFANEIGVEWAGALAFGMGPSIEGGSVERSPLAKLLPQFDAAADELAAGRVIPTASTDAFAQPMAPAWTYPLVGGWVWKRQARKRGCTEPLRLRRYAQ